MKKVLALLLILILSSFSLFAMTAAETKEVVTFLPRDVVNNSNKQFNLANGVITQAPTSGFNYSSSNGALFRVLSSLQKPKNGTTYRVEIESDWKFVHETNPTSTVDFSLDIYKFEVEMKKENESGQYDYDNAVATKESYTVNASHSYFDIDYTTVTRITNFYIFTTTYANIIRYYDGCIKFNAASGIEIGNYTAQLKITLTPTQYGRSSDVGAISENITIYAYYGVTPDNTDFNAAGFTINSAAKTYSVDLESTSIQNVAIINFSAAGTMTHKPGDDDIELFKKKYRILVSPISDKADTTAQYKFRRMGTEGQIESANNTVYYTLYAGSSGNTPLNNSVRDDRISALSGTGGIQRIDSNTFAFYPNYSSTRVSSDYYTNTWSLSAPLYIRVDAVGTIAGVYTSTIYFMLESE